MPYNFISLSDTVKVPAIVPKDDFYYEFLQRIENYLRNIAYINHISKDDNNLKFTGPVFRFTWNGWNLFNPVSNGSFHLHRYGSYYIIRYKIFFWEFFVYSLLFSTIAFFGFFPNDFFRGIYLFVVWSLFAFHSLWSKNRLEKLLETLSQQITEDYLDSQKPNEQIAG